MKKAFLLLTVLVLLSGCGQKQENTSVVPQASKDSTNLYQQLAEQSNQIKQEDMQNSNELLAPGSQPDLLSKYSTAVLQTNLGDIEIEFYGQDSPDTVNNFLYLAEQGFYDGTSWHRVIKNFMIQGGDPLSKDDDRTNDGTGGPNYRFRDEFNDHRLVRGSLAMANSGADTNGSQFFIVTTESTPWLDGRHTNFGQVTNGFDIIDQIEASQVDANDHPLTDIVIQKIILQ